MATCVLDGRTVEVAAGGQTVFTIGWDATLVNDADVLLWFEDVSAGTPGAEATQGAGAGQFSVDRTAGTCTLVTPAEVNDIITMERHQSSPVRKTTFTNPGDLIPQSLNNEFNHFLQLIEDLGRDRCRSVRMDRGVDLTGLDLELPEPEVGRAIGWVSSTVLGNIGISFVGGGGTLDTIPLWTPDGFTLGDSVMTQSGTTITSDGSFVANGDITANTGNVSSTKSAGTANLIATNTSAGAAVVSISTQAGSLDPSVQWQVLPAGQAYALGIDNSDSDNFVGSVGAVLGTANWLVVTSAGAVTFPVTSASVATAAAGADVRLLVENTSDAAGSSATLEIKNGFSNADGPVLLFDYAALNWGWAIDVTIDGGAESAFILFTGTDPYLDANQIMTITPSNIGLGDISSVSGELPVALLHLARLNTVPQIELERIDTSVSSGDIISEIETRGGETVVTEIVRMIVEADADWGPSDSPTRFSIWTTPIGTTTPVEGFRLNNAGNVSILGNVTSSGEVIGVASSLVGSSIQLLVQNGDDTDLGSDAQVLIITEDSTGGDPYTEWKIGVVAQSYVMGIDNSDSDNFVGSVGSALGTANWIEVTTAGDVDLTGEITVSAGSVTVATGNIVITAGNLGVGTTPLTDVHADMNAPADLTTLAGSMFLQAFNNAGDGNFGAGIIFGSANGGVVANRGSSIMGYQPTADADTAGLILSTHGTSSGAPRIEAMRLDENQNTILNGILTVPKTSTNGIKVDRTTPTFGFADILGDQFSKNTGATQPTLTAYNGAVFGWQFAASDEAFMSFHIPHDYVKGTDIFLHIHWSHIGTLVTGGTITFKITSIYAKGHNQEAFTSTPASGTFTGTASTTQYQHIISEAQYSDSTPTGIQVDTDLLEPDGVIEMTFEVDANDITVSGGGVPDPFIHFVDIHYQTTGLIGTKDKVPDFYA